MFTRILTAHERNEITKYLQESNAKRTHLISVTASRTRAHTPLILSDLALLRSLVEKYDREKTRGN
jgi:hypothetical protein